MTILKTTLFSLACVCAHACVLLTHFRCRLFLTSDLHRGRAKSYVCPTEITGGGGRSPDSAFMDVFSPCFMQVHVFVHASVRVSVYVFVCVHAGVRVSTESFHCVRQVVFSQI